MAKATKVKKQSKAPMIIFMGFVILTVASLGKQFISDDKSIEDTSLADMIWEESYRNAEENRVGVDFKEITTTEEEYERLRLECNRWIARNNSDIKVETNRVDTETKITEEVYIDNLKDGYKENKRNETNTELNEVGPIYLQDMLILRYIDDNGFLKIIGAVKDGDEYRIQELGKLEEDADSLDVDEKMDLDNDKLMSEETYLKNICDSFLNIMNAKDIEELEKAKIEALKFFTKEGRGTVLSGKSDIHVIEKTTTKVKFIEAGKSDNNTFKNDRIYMRLAIDNGNEEVYFNVILKINSNGMIFDTDII